MRRPWFDYVVGLLTGAFFAGIAALLVWRHCP
jgi:hypothetical protein